MGGKTEPLFEVSFLICIKDDKHDSKKKNSRELICDKNLELFLLLQDTNKFSQTDMCLPHERKLNHKF